MMPVMRPLRVRSSSRALAFALSIPVLAACGGGGSTVTPPPPPPPPVTFPIAPGAAVTTHGYSGGAITFNFGSGVPSGESFTVGPLAKPTPPSCPPNLACLLPPQPTDAVSITVGPAALPLSALTSVALSGFAVQAASFTLVDTSVDEGTTTFSSTPSGGPLVETHASPDEGAPIVTLQPNRSYVLTLWGFASIDKPAGSTFIPAGGTLSATVPSNGDTITLTFGNAIPAKQWIQFTPVTQLNITLPPNTIDAIAIETSAKSLPPSVITGVILTTTRAFSGTRLEAGLTGVASEAALSTGLPLALAPPGTQPDPSQLTFQTSPDFGTSLSAIHPSVSYVLSIRAY